MATFCVFTRPEAPIFAKLYLWLMDLPAEGVDVGGGVHVPHAAAPPNPCPLQWVGWTTRHRSWIAKPSNNGSATDEFAVRVTAELAAAWQAKKNQLTPAQRTFVQNHLDSAADLAAEWLVNVNGTPTLIETADVEPEP